MKRLHQLLSLTGLLIWSASALAATDPIQWVKTQSLPSQVVVGGGTYVTSYRFTNHIPFTMTRPFMVEKISFPESEFTFNDLCSGKKLTYLESCTVTVYLAPQTNGVKQLRLIEAYAHDRVPLPGEQSTAIGTNNSLSITGALTTALPSTLDINQSAPWKVTYTNSGTSSATGIEINVIGDAYNTNCGTTLSNIAPGNTCYVQGAYTATATGSQTISSTLTSAQGASVTVSTSTNVSGQNSGLVCTPAVPLAPETLINTSNPVTLLCTNKSGANITITGHTPTYPLGGAQGTFTPASGGDNCTPGILPNNASCQLKGDYVAPGSAISGITISLLVNYDTTTMTGLSASTSTETDVVTVINNQRLITLINNCSFDVSWSMSGGAVTNSPVCSSNTDCPKGSSCNISSKICYYNNYGPKTGAYMLTSGGGTATTQIIQTAASTVQDNVLWKGVISASTACSGTTCANNACQNNGGTTSCAPGLGFGQPATEAEFTFLLTGSSRVDTYDITNVNGFSMPMSMATNQAASNYECGTAGNHLAAGSLKACNFTSVTPPTNMYYWVSLTGTACTAQNTCSNSSQICGLAFNPSTNNFAKNCGSFLGYWAANEICQTRPNFSSPFGDSFTCDQYLSTPFPSSTYTLTQLLKCSPPSSTAPLFNSCYLSYSGATATALTQCCGCTNWTGVATPSASCPVGQTDPQWVSHVLPLIQWMKQACPTSYAYPFDDKASTFQCTAASTTEYTITFCPGGANDTGLPTGKTDGRN